MPWLFLFLSLVYLAAADASFSHISFVLSPHVALPSASIPSLPSLRIFHKLVNPNHGRVPAPRPTITQATFLSDIPEVEFGSEDDEQGEAEAGDI